MNIIGPKVRKLRELQKLTQEQAVAHLNQLGWDISRGTYAKIESQNRQVSDIEIPLLAKYLSVNIETLFER